MNENPPALGWWKAADGGWHPPDSVSPPSTTQSTRDYPDQDAHPWFDQQADRRRGGLRFMAIAAAALILGVGGLLFTLDNESAEDLYLVELSDANLMSWATDRAAVNAGYLVCERLDGGAPARGSDADLIAVEHLCPDYAESFRVLANTTIEGSFTVVDDDADYDLVGCKPEGGFADINSSTQVIVRSGTGTELARTSLGTGLGIGELCTFNFAFDLTEGESVYIVAVGDRGEVSYDWARISQPGAIALSLG